MAHLEVGDIIELRTEHIASCVNEKVVCWLQMSTHLDGILRAVSLSWGAMPRCLKNWIEERRRFSIDRYSLTVNDLGFANVVTSGHNTKMTIFE